MVDGVPVAGVVFAPAIGRMFFGAVAKAPSRPSAANTADLGARAPTADGLVAVGSRSPSRCRDRRNSSRPSPIKGHISAGSSLKFCLVAAGEADIYARGGRTMEWDTAAGHAVLAAAGGSVTTWDGAPLRLWQAGL